MSLWSNPQQDFLGTTLISPGLSRAGLCQGRWAAGKTLGFRGFTGLRCDKQAAESGDPLSTGGHQTSKCTRGGSALTAARLQQASRSQRRVPRKMFAKLGQMFNSAGIVFTLNVVCREPRVALPHVAVPDISWIDWQALKKSGFQGVILDKDNTITAPYVQTVWPSLASSLEDCKKAFNGRVALLSNSAGLYQYDPNGIEAKALEDTLRIPVIRHGSKKPSGSAEELEKHFGCDASSLVMVGDRYFTDIVYGNKNGLLTFITKPLTIEGEPFIIRRVRALEEFLVQRWREKGVMPIKHKLLPQSHQFVKDLAKK